RVGASTDRRVIAASGDRLGSRRERGGTAGAGRNLGGALVVRIPVEGFTLAAATRWIDGAKAAVLCHPHPPFGGRMDTPLLLALDDALHRAGWSTVRFNFRGLDGSEGIPTGGQEEHRDVQAVVGWARACGARGVALVGYSFGALMAARAIADGAAVIACA